MCGITGFTWKDKALLDKMTCLVEHRGPDDLGDYVAKGISLGHRRLSIIDTSKKGHQPMFNEKKSVAVVFNGEIWNYKKLKALLESKGHTFKSGSDTEVIVHGYEEYGAEICSYLDGMFAFALWDTKKQSLLLARDRQGKKPLYYSVEKKGIIFSSEIKSLLAHVKPEINEHCLAQYLTLRFSPHQITMFKNVLKLAPGTYALFSQNRLTIKPYYTLPAFTVRNKPDAEKADTLISTAVEKRLIADVPLGVFLSGGLDSSALVAYLARFRKNIHTFSATFDSSVDESKYARIIARQFNTAHREIKISSDMLSYLPEVIYHFDEPLADPAALPTYLLCKEVSKDVKVVLSGEGGDEVFGGYDNFNYIPMLKRIHRIPFFLRKYVASPVVRLFASLHTYPRKQMLFAASEILSKRSLAESFKEMFYFPFNADERKKLLNGSEMDAFDVLMRSSASIEEATQKYYFKEWLPNDLLMKADKMAMAHGLEIRTPFLDKDLIDYFTGLPYAARHKRKLFRQVVSKMLPAKIMRKKKQGFTLPLVEWLGKPEIRARIAPFIARLKKRGIFEESYLDSLLRDPTAFKNEHKLWVLLNFEIWCEIYLDKVPYRSIRI